MLRVYMIVTVLLVYAVLFWMFRMTLYVVLLDVLVNLGF